MQVSITRRCRTRYIEGLFKLTSVQRHAGYRGLNRDYLLILNNETQSFDAIAGGEERLAPGQLVSVLGCLLTRGGFNVLGVSSLKILALSDQLSVFPEEF